jgi:hypothetical protein
MSRFANNFNAHQFITSAPSTTFATTRPFLSGDGTEHGSVVLVLSGASELKGLKIQSCPMINIGTRSMGMPARQRLFGSEAI